MNKRVAPPLFQKGSVPFICKPFRFAVGERILAESAECLRAIVLANAVDKTSAGGRRDGAREVRNSFGDIL